MITRKWISVFVFLILLVLACGNSNPSGSTGNSEEEDAPADVAEQKESPTEAPDDTPTPEPPTATPEPTPTQGPPPTPVALSGSGDSVVDIPGSGPMIARIKGNDEASFFAVTALDAANETIDLLVNTTAAYQGVRPLNLGDKQTAKFEIKSSGPWSIELLPLESAEVLAIPGEYAGEGDQVLIVEGTPGTATITGNEGKGFFAVIGHGALFPDLLVNTTDTYSGQSIVDKDVTTLIIQATGPWSIKME